MLQNRSSSTESAHADTEASVNGHCLDSSDKSMKCASKKCYYIQAGKELDLENFCEVRMIWRQRQNLEVSWNIFLELKLDLDNFCPK